MIDSEAKTMTSYICTMVKTEDRKAEYIKEMKNIDVDISKLQVILVNFIF